MRRPGLVALVKRLLARWLRRLAARLDSSYRLAMAPAAFDALAHRFPGAPEHWLREIADHVDSWEEAAPDEVGISPPEPEQTVAAADASARRAPAFRLRQPRPEFQLSRKIEPLQAGRRLFRSLPLRRRPLLRWLAGAGERGRRTLELSSSLDRSEAPAPWRAAPARGPRRLQAPFSRFLGRGPQPRVEPTPDPPRSGSVHIGDTMAGSRASRILALMTGVRRREHLFVGDIAETGPRPVLHWPQPATSSQSIDRQGAAAGMPERPIQTWAAAAGVWPELPKVDREIADAAPNVRPLHDFTREQMAGLWSA